MRNRSSLRNRRPSRAAEERIYSKERPLFLNRPENQWCPVWLSGKLGTPQYVRTAIVHHKRGRENYLLLDKRFWLAVSPSGHDWIEKNRKVATQMGWILPGDNKAFKNWLLHNEHPKEWEL